MKQRINGVFTVIIALFLVMIFFGQKSNDEAFYEKAKSTTGVIKMISEEKKVVYRRRRVGAGSRRKTITQYNAHITFEAEENGKLVSKTVLIKDVSSNLKEGETITVYYHNDDVRIKSQSQAKSSNIIFGFFAFVLLIIGIIRYYNAKPESEYDELSGEENIYRER